MCVLFVDEERVSVVTGMLTERFTVITERRSTYVLLSARVEAVEERLQRGVALVDGVPVPG